MGVIETEMSEPTEVTRYGELFLEALKGDKLILRASARAPLGSLPVFEAGNRFDPGEAVQHMPARLEGELLQRSLHVYVRSCMTGFVQLLQDGVGAVHVGDMMFVMMQRELGLGDMRLTLQMGHISLALSHTVTAKSNRVPRYSSILFDRLTEISIPISLPFTARGSAFDASTPALWTSYCKENIPLAAVRCPHCTSDMAGK